MKIITAGFERALVTELFEAPITVLGFDKGGNHSGEFVAVPIGAAVDNLLLEGAVEAFNKAVGFGFAQEGKIGIEAIEMSGLESNR